MQFFCSPIKPVFRWLIGIILALFISSTISFILLFSSYKNHFFQGIYLDKLSLGGLNKAQALEKVLKNQKNLPNFSILVQIDDAKFATTSADLDQKIDYRQALAAAYDLGRTDSLFHKLKTVFQLYTKPRYFYSEIQFNQNKLDDFLKTVKEEIDSPGELPSAKLFISQNPNSIKIFPGKIGRELNIDENLPNLNQLLVEFANNKIYPNQSSVLIFKPNIASTSAQLDELEITNAKQRVQKFIGANLTLETLDKKFLLNDQKIVALLTFPAGFHQERLAEKVTELAQQIDRPAQNAVFEYDKKSLVITNFVPDKQGLVLNQTETQNLLIKNLIKIEQAAETNSADQKKDAENKQLTLQLPIKTTQADISLDQTNDLGIKEKIGFGESYYAHSIPNRIHNVALTASKLNYTLIKPGEQFSFNQTLGEVSARTGFKSAYVIRNGRTELGDGGGVCQVSTTMFRVLLDAGLKITKRKPHSYRVSYYELNNNPGYDATVYAGDTDLRFVNDTNHYVLIYTKTDSKKLYMTIELYGTSDGRTTQIVDYQKWGYRSAPAPVYIPDSSLPPGKLVKVDWAASGINAKFTHIITDKAGNLMSETTYESHYRPWSAKYLQGV